MDSKDAKILNENVKNLAKSTEQLSVTLIEIGRNAAKAQHPAYQGQSKEEISGEIQVTLDFGDVPIRGTAVVVRNKYSLSGIDIYVNREDTEAFFEAVDKLPLEALLISATDPDV